MIVTEDGKDFSNVFTPHFKKLAILYQLPKFIKIRKLGFSSLK